MKAGARLGAVIFAADHRRLADFYAAVTDLPVRLTDSSIVVLHSDRFELVIHKLSGEQAPCDPPTPRRDSYVKLFFPVESLASIRDKVVAFGGQIDPVDKEWSARGFRACEAIDPEGNVIQFRQDAP